MEKANKSSFTADLFGPKDSSTSSAGYFGSIFGSPTISMVPGREPHPQDFNGYGNIRHETAKDYKSEKFNPKKNEKNPSYNENGRPIEPCYYNSSIHYGGQEVYSPTTRNNPPHNFNKDGDQNESNSSGASRGNWWQGSLYY